MSSTRPQNRPLSARVAGQGALLAGGFAVAQALSFLRNAIFAYALAKGDFGIAASLLLVLQMAEQLTDLGADRLIVQAPDGDDARFVATQHLGLVLRGVLTALVLYALAEPLARFFHVEGARWAFQAIALVPFIKGFQHLDYRRAQRRLDNGPQLKVDVLPQAVALMAVPLALAVSVGFAAVVLVSLAQAIAQVAASHLLAERPYALAADRLFLKRLVAFGWPILLSALPLAAVFHLDRLVVARFGGLEALAAYTVAFMATMVPGLVAAKVGHALMLPLFAAAAGDARQLNDRFRALSEATVLIAAVYLVLFLIAGEAVVRLAFGPQYGGLGAVVSWLAAMWSLRMIQAVPGMALMAQGETRPFLVAGIIRATAAVPAVMAAWWGLGLAGVAAAGAAGELASLVYIGWRSQRLGEGLGRILLSRSLVLVPAGLLGLAAVHAFAGADRGVVVAVAVVAAAGVLAAGVAIAPSLRKLLPGFRASPSRAPAPRLG